MKFRRGYQSRNVEDRRGAGPTGGLGGLGKVGGGVGGLVVVALVLTQCLAAGGGGFPDLSQIDPGAIEDIDSGLPGGETGGQGAAPLDPAADPDEDLRAFVSFVLDDVQSYWAEEFTASGQEYQDARLVLFTGSTESQCGGASAEIGPHYCPPDQTVYIDLDFMEELLSRLGASGDFAQAYVLAHEIGHHVQTITGISQQVQDLAQQHPDERNDLSILQELQADCLAGTWAYNTFEAEQLDTGDIDEAIDAAASVGDDRIQEAATGRIDRESWTHGSAEQRKEWFARGFETGDPEQCNTFEPGVE